MRKPAQLIPAALAVVALFSVMALASPVCAQDNNDATMTQPPAAAAPMKAHKGGAPMQHVEDRIKTLHEKLKITSAQEPQWDAVAQAMRDNANAIHALIEERHQNAKTMTAVDDLESYEKITDQHADGLKKLIPVFQTLYDTMSPEQKANADKVFGQFEGHRHPKAASGK